jgi:hypothetical protein
MAVLLHQRCFNHFSREAVARCRECARFFCRECVTEHDHRMICAVCLSKLVKPPLMRRHGFVVGVRTVQWFAALTVLWLFFYLVGKGLLAIPSSFHEGVVWEEKLLQNQ